MLISALVFGGIPKDAVKKAYHEAEIWVSPQLLREYRDVPIELKAENKITPSQFKILISAVASFVANAKVAIPKKRLLLCRDEKDNAILECCLAVAADFLITGDKDLLEIGEPVLKTEFSKLRIVSPKGFLKE